MEEPVEEPVVEIQYTTPDPTPPETPTVVDAMEWETPPNFGIVVNLFNSYSDDADTDREIVDWLDGDSDIEAMW